VSPYVPFVPTPMDVAERMLELAGVTEEDVVYDLGCGDGRIVILAAKKFGARAVGVEIDPELLWEAERNARKEGVEDRVTFLYQDALKVDLSGATVVALFLLPKLNRMLRPKLLAELKPGARVVSHDFDMGSWEPDKFEEVKGEDGGTHRLYLWRIKRPAKVAGRWRWTERGPWGKEEFVLELEQHGGAIEGMLFDRGGAQAAIRDSFVSGRRIHFVASLRDGKIYVKRFFWGTAAGDRIEGTVEVRRGGGARVLPWQARRVKRWGGQLP